MSQPTVEEERKILEQEVLFYKKLTPPEKLRFENSLRRFLEKVSITGVKTTVSDSDKVFVAAAAIIPIFAFPGWEYRNINEVLLYPESFSHDYQLEGKGRNISGMVGTGPMQNVMILSKHDLQNAFHNKTDKDNTPVHEFVHLIDKADGETDGLPSILLEHRYAVPWLKLVHQEIQLIHSGKSDINPYAATNEAEFLAVAAEYFFEQPQRMEDKHPELYGMLHAMFSAPQNQNHIGT